MINQLPVYKVLTVINRNTREKFKCRCNKVKVIAYTADAGIGIKAGNYRIFVFHTLTTFVGFILYIYFIIGTNKNQEKEKHCVCSAFCFESS